MLQDPAASAQIEHGGSELVALLVFLYVAAPQRGKGAGRKALAAAVQAAWAARALRVVAIVAAENVTGVKLLRDGGFSLVEQFEICAETHLRLELQASSERTEDCARI